VKKSEIFTRSNVKNTWQGRLSDSAFGIILRHKGTYEEKLKVKQQKSFSFSG
jgi:hypothetical protein